MRLCLSMRASAQILTCAALLLAACSPPSPQVAQPTPTTIPLYAVVVTDVDPQDCKRAQTAPHEALALECFNEYAGTYRRVALARRESDADYRISVPWRPSPTPTPFPTPRPTSTPWPTITPIANRGGL